MYTYTWYQWITFFFIYCFIGWIFESTYVSLKKGYFVNRGFLRLPMLPLYGSGAIMMLWVSLPVKDNIFLVYLSGLTAATLLEYITGYVMERLFKMKYWDYSNQLLNLHGYICLSSSIAWGFLTIFLTEVIHTPIEHLVLKMNPIADILLISVLGILFIADTIQSTREALDLKHVLESMSRIKTQLEEMQLQIALLKSETSQKFSDLKEDTIQKAANLKGEAEIKLFQLRKENELKIESLKTKQKNLSEPTGFKKFYRKSLLRGNPTMSSKQFNDSLKELKETMEIKKHHKKS